MRKCEVRGMREVWGSARKCDVRKCVEVRSVRNDGSVQTRASDCFGREVVRGERPRGGKGGVEYLLQEI